MRSDTIKNLSLSLLAITLAVCAISLTLRVRQSIALLDYSINELKNKAGNTVTLTSDLLKESKGVIKAFRDESETREAIQNRKDAYRVGSQGVYLLEHLRGHTLPAFDAAIVELQTTTRASTALIQNADKHLNEQLLPELTSLLTKLETASEQTGKDIHTLLLEADELLRNSTKAVLSVNNLVNEPEWKQTLQNIEAATRNTASGSASLAKAAASIDAGFNELPEQMRAIRDILNTGKRNQKIWLIVRLLGNALGVIAAIQ